ncbi:hypothetical protein A4G99_02300 [Haladaptatus sp. R4]|nr:hypothetical protein A4G99_02300 [Haladaptatus sp. R4]
MTDYNVHEPELGGTTDDDWSASEERGFGTDDLSDTASHFVLSSSGFDSPRPLRSLPVIRTPISPKLQQFGDVLDGVSAERTAIVRRKSAGLGDGSGFQFVKRDVPPTVRTDNFWHDYFYSTVAT